MELSSGIWETSPPAFLGSSAPGVIHQEMTHHLGREVEEIRPAVELNFPLPPKPEIHLAHQRRGLEGVGVGFPMEKIPRHSMKIIEDHRKQLVQCRQIAIAPGPSCRPVMSFSRSMMGAKYSAARFVLRDF